MPRTSIQTQEKQGSADYEERKPGKNFRPVDVSGENLRRVGQAPLPVGDLKEAKRRYSNSGPSSPLLGLRSFSGPFSRPCSGSSERALSSGCVRRYSAQR